MNKRTNEVHRVINGKEYVHTIEKEYEDDPSAAQKLQRAIFGKTNAIVNGIMSDPEQVKEWTARMEEANRAISLSSQPSRKRWVTVRQYVYAVISEELKRKPAAKRRRAKLPYTLPRGVKLHVAAFSDLTAAELYEMLKARFHVFVCEQHIHYLDEDNIDYVATHFSLRKRGLVVAYARLFPDAQEGVLNIGRMLTIERNKGFAGYLLLQMEQEALNRGAHTLRLHAQLQVAAFYEHMGFQTVGQPFAEAGLPHILMEKKIG